MAERHLLKCLSCGRLASRRAFTQGALGYQAQALRQRFVTKGTGQKRDGSRGGAVIWDRRAMSREELEHVGRAISTGAFIVTKLLDDKLPPPIEPDDVLAAIDSDEEFTELGNDWLKEVEDELTRRRAILNYALEARTTRRANVR